MKSGAALGAFLLTGALVSCADQPGSEIWNDQWQVTQFSTGGTAANVDSRSVDIPQNMAGRVFLVLTQDSLRGASGCMDLAANVTWEDDTFVTEDVTTTMNEDATCFPGDEDTADRLAEALSQRTFTWSEPAENNLRLEANQGDDSQLTTPPFIELVTS